MIISCGNRRLVGTRFGWKIEIQHERKRKDGTIEKTFVEDRPAYPATLEHACVMLQERISMDGGDCLLDELPARLERATHAVRKYMEQARKAV